MRSPPWRRPISARCVCAVLAAMVVAWWCSGTSTAKAQVIRLPPETAAVPADDEDDEEKRQQPNQGGGFLDESNFEAWVWNNGSNSLAAGKARLETQLMLMIDEVSRTCGLTDRQKEKLKLAGDLDLQRFIDRYQKIRRRFMQLRANPNAMNEIWPVVQPLQQAVQTGLFEDASIFQRTLAKTLEKEQQATYDREGFIRREYRFHAKLELAIVALDETIGMNAASREKLLVLAREKCRVPRRFGQYDFYVVMHELGRIPEEQIRPLFSDEQWQNWQQCCNQFRGMEQFLRQNGMLPEDDPVPKQPLGNPVPAQQVEEKKPDA